jgi:hypothetical protein
MTNIISELQLEKDIQEIGLSYFPVKVNKIHRPFPRDNRQAPSGNCRRPYFYCLASDSIDK